MVVQAGSGTEECRTVMGAHSDLLRYPGDVRRDVGSDIKTVILLINRDPHILADTAVLPFALDEQEGSTSRLRLTDRGEVLKVRCLHNLNSLRGQVGVRTGTEAELSGVRKEDQAFIPTNSSTECGYL